jgi:phage terminase small subunit
MTIRVVKDDNLTMKQRRFVDAILSDKYDSQIACYMDVYDVELDDKGNVPKWANVECTRLMQNPKITLSIREGLKAKEQRLLASTLRTKDYVLKKLYSLAEEDIQASSKIRALELLGKSVAMFTDVQETKEKELEEKINQLLS